MAKKDNEILNLVGALKAKAGQFYIVATMNRRPTYDTIKHDADRYQKERQADVIVNLLMNRDYVLVQTEYDVTDPYSIFMEMDRIHFMKDEQHARKIIGELQECESMYVRVFSMRAMLDCPNSPVDVEGIQFRLVQVPVFE